MNNQCILRIQVNRESLYLENLSDLTTGSRSIVKSGVALTVHRFQVQLAQEDSKSGLTDLVAL